jgi:hypothetical protein
VTEPRRRPPPNLEDPWVVARLERSELGREALRRYEASKRPNLKGPAQRAERRIAEKRAREVLDHDEGGPA